jgi:hypothetical protein
VVKPRLEPRTQGYLTLKAQPSSVSGCSILGQGVRILPHGDQGALGLVIRAETLFGDRTMAEGEGSKSPEPWEVALGRDVTI